METTDNLPPDSGEVSADAQSLLNDIQLTPTEIQNSAADSETLGYLTEISDYQLRQVELLHEMYSLLYISVIAVGVILVFILVWRAFRAFV